MRWSPGSCKRWRSRRAGFGSCAQAGLRRHIFGAQGGAIWQLTATQVILDTPAAEFRLPATDGRTYALDDVAGEKGTVVVFICNHCPYVKAVIDRIVADVRVLTAERAERSRCPQQSR